MVIIKFSVKGQMLILETDLRRMKVTSDTLNYFKCQFKFNDAWDGFEKRIYFKNASFNITKSTLLDNEGYCFIPWEVLAHTGIILCNVTGIKYIDGEPIRLTAGPIRMFVHNFGSEEQLVKRIENKKATIDPLKVFCQREEGTLEPDYQMDLTPTEFEQFVAQVKHYRDEMAEMIIDIFSGDYNDLENKPSIEDVTLIGNKTFEELTLVNLSNEELEVLLY